MLCEYMPPELTLITRAGALRSSRPRSSAIRANGARTWVANISSCPSAERVRCAGIRPALLTSTSRRDSSAVNRSANVRS